mmetsp:Transcript_34108/g.82735  ORF Transcript_34108/g.82735 Transcript_34108/m.82735 type:complete len:402 (-) Transcript_34108:607-1812(-)
MSTIAEAKTKTKKVPPPNLVIPPKKPKLNKAERRALQQKQRAAKAAAYTVNGGGNNNIRMTGAPGNRETRKRMAEETVRVTETGILPLAGSVEAAAAGELDISSLVQESVQGTCSYSQSAAVPKPLPKKKGIITSFHVVNTTTLDAAQRLLQSAENDDIGNVAALNFASAKNPGGGFLRGAMAQEESLALHSGLYACLKDDEMYDYHRNKKSSLSTGIYSDWVIFSPNVPVFRRETDGAFTEPWPCSFITCPCVNNNVGPSGHGLLYGRGKKNKNNKNVKTEKFTNTGQDKSQLLHKRAKRMLQVVAAHHDGPLVLGAWGCGVFRNDPNTVANIFSNLLRLDKMFVNRWPTVVFAVLDNNAGETIRPFEAAFGAAAATSESSSTTTMTTQDDDHEEQENQG